MKPIAIVLSILIFSSMVANAQTHEERMRFLDSVNKYRAEAGLRPYIYDSRADTLTKLRNLTVTRYIQANLYEYYQCKIHDDQKKLRQIMHYGFHVQIERFNLDIIHQDSTITSGECAAAFKGSNEAKYDTNPEDLFLGWKGSPDHWKLIMNPKYQYLSLSWETCHTRYGPILISHLIVFDTRLRTPDTIKYYKCTNVLRPGYK